MDLIMAVEEMKYTMEFLSLTAESSEEDSKRAYDSMANNWDKVSENVGYVGYSLCVEAFDKATESPDIFPNPRKDIKTLDAGAGTGMVGKLLVERGYTNIDALDISQKMLDIAEKKPIYKRLMCAALSEKRISVIETAEYDVVICAGVIVYGQVMPKAILEILRFIKPGGLFVVTIRVDSYDPEKYKYKEVCEQLEREMEVRGQRTSRTSLDAKRGEVSILLFDDLQSVETLSYRARTTSDCADCNHRNRMKTVYLSFAIRLISSLNITFA